MEPDDILLNTKSLLDEYYNLGQEQLKYLKKIDASNKIKKTIINGQRMVEYNGVFIPAENALSKIMVQENIFLFSLIENFWKYFLLNKNNIESPSRQGIDRTLIDICYQKVATYFSLTDSQKKRQSLLSSIIDSGILLANPKHLAKEDYDFNYRLYSLWCNDLTLKEDKVKYLDIQEEGYPLYKLSKSQSELWPNFYNAFNGYSELTFPWAPRSKNGQEDAKNGFMDFYQLLHGFVHGSHLSIIPSLESEVSMKHLFASVSVSVQTGYQMLEIINKYCLSETPILLESVFLETKRLLPLIRSRYSHLT